MDAVKQARLLCIVARLEEADRISKAAVAELREIIEFDQDIAGREARIRAMMRETGGKQP